MKALCVVPFGMEEGTQAEIREREFGLVVGEPAVFHLLASTTRKNDSAGEIIEDWSHEIEEVSTMETALGPAPPSSRESAVRFAPESVTPSSPGSTSEGAGPSAASTSGTPSGGTLLPVWLESRFTEVGTLELWCVSRDRDRRWRLEFNLREERAE
jgi:hypothetical protein